MNKQEHGSTVEDTLINVKDSLSKMTLSALGFNLDEIFYTIWEDSSDGHIHLFGRRQLYPVGAVLNESIIDGYVLEQNYPNPFNPSTKIKFEIPVQARNDNVLVTLKVYDVLGNEIATLVNEVKPAGEYEIEFNGSNFSTGIYFYKITTGDFSQTRKMVLIK